MKNFLCFLLVFGVVFGAAPRRVEQAPEGGNSSNRKKSVVDEPVCDEVIRICGSLSENNDFLVLECVQSLDPASLARINTNCQNVIWQHIRELIDNQNVKNLLDGVCQHDLERFKCSVDSPAGGYLKCVVSNREEIQNAACISLVLRLENIAFSDYQWIQSFLEHCESDIKKLNCGRVDGDTLGQSSTLVCLQTQQNAIQDTCKREVLKLSEIQADNIKLDRQLYKDCAEDHMRYCQQFTPGTGRVFTCLLQLRQDKLRPQCKKSILRRQKLITQDYRISKNFMRACREEIKKHHCRKQTSTDRNIRLAQVLLCLENVVKNGTTLDQECEAEMMDHRKMLMEDYRLSPEIVDGCKGEIEGFCNGLEAGGKTIHCLMEHARATKKKRIGDVCLRALEVLVKETDVGEDWRVDPVLYEACTPVVKVLCRGVRGGNARVLSCLMDNIGADSMTEECEDALIQIQYFIARDFKMDPQLYGACRYDAARLCHADQSWEGGEHFDPNTGPLVLPCLYRYAYHEEQKLKLNRSCLDQIRRVMRQRAISVDLIPEIEEVCLPDLAMFCFDQTQKHEEMQCLQKNIDHLKDNCQDALSKFTEMEVSHVELNPYLMKNCRRVLDMYCSNEMKNDEGSAMDCLITHKNYPDVKKDAACRVSIEHVQIISLRDYKFSYKFKMACRPYAEKHCSDSKTKADVVTCLSEKVTNDTINGIRSDIHKECRQQLKAQLFQQRENIDFDPKLKAACGADIIKFCKNVDAGSAQVLECLQSVQEKLTQSCENELFKVKRQEITDNSVDYALMTMCEGAIEQFCPQYEKEHVLDCLKMHKDEKGFSKKCRLIVVHRMIEQNSNYRLNPGLQKNCKLDIKKFCFNHIVDTKPGYDMNEPVIKCLKTAFKNAKLTETCEKEMAGILHDQALDINLNPLLRAVCRDELQTICKPNDEADAGDAEECLKTALLEKRIPTPACQNEVAAMIQESQADIQVDPPLQKACALDLLNFCSDVPQGNGRHIKCLQIIMDQNAKRLTKDCRSMLTKRLEMYKNAAQVAPPADFQELYNQVVASPAKHYFFLMMLMVVGIIFVMGMFCGRASRKHMLLKNK